MASPLLTGFSVSTSNVGAGALNFAVEAADGSALPYTVHVVGVPAGTGVPTAAQVRLGLRSDGIAAPAAASVAYSVEGTQTVADRTVPVGTYDFHATVRSGDAAEWDGVLTAANVNLDLAGVSGSLSAQEVGADTIAAGGDVVVAGAVAAQETGTDALAASGDVAISGSLASDETGSDGFAASGGVTASGSLAAQETGTDTLAGNGGVAVSGALAAVGAGSDGFTGTGTVEATGGASGNYTFTIPQITSIALGGLTHPATANLPAATTSGNLLLAFCMERSGGNVANHDITESGHTWTRVPALDIDNSVGGNEGNTRMTFSLWWRVAAGETITPVNFTDGTSNGKEIWLVEIAPSAPYDWTYAAAGIVGTGAGDIDNHASPSVSGTGDDLLVISVAASRLGTGPSFIAFNEVAVSEDGIGNTNAAGFAVGVRSPSQASGSYVSTITTGGTGAGNEGVCGTLIFKDGV